MARWIPIFRLAAGFLLGALAAPAVGAGCPPAGTVKQQAIAKVNAIRAEGRRCGFRYFGRSAPLQWNDKLLQAARHHAEEMSRTGLFSHRGRDGSVMGDRMKRAGYDWRVSGENIAWGPHSVERVTARWFESSQHCANLMAAKFNEFALACAVGKSGKTASRPYWVLVLGTRL